jgi:hypothetical protein
VNESSLQSIELRRTRFVSRAWPREYLDVERVEDFAALYREQGVEALPPLELVPDGSGFFLLADGVHRREAAQAADLTNLPARVLSADPGLDPVEFAYLRALACSAISAKPLSRAEKQAAIRRLLTEKPGASDREIGRLVGVDHKTVGRLRRGDSPAQKPADWVPGPSPRAVAKRLFLAFEKAHEARGLGIADFFTGDRTGERLAEVLVDVYGAQAREKAEQFREWLDGAVSALEESGS